MVRRPGPGVQMNGGGLDKADRTSDEGGGRGRNVGNVGETGQA